MNFEDFGDRGYVFIDSDIFGDGSLWIMSKDGSFRRLDIFSEFFRFVNVRD